VAYAQTPLGYEQAQAVPMRLHQVSPRTF
jgi:hypothetical protein